MHAARGLFALALLGACGRLGFDAQSGNGAPDADPDAVTVDAAWGERPPEFTSGTRLRAATYQAGDVELFHQWFDTQLGVTCSPSIAADGQLRCLPNGIANVAYADSACTQPLIITTDYYGDEATCPLSTMGAVRTDDRTTIYAAGAAHTGPTYGTDSLGVCGEVTYQAPAIYLRGPEVPSTTFVRFTEARIPRGRLSYVNLLGDDGAQQLSTSLFDTELDAPCSFAELSTGVGHCLGGDFAFAQMVYADATCNTALLMHEPAEAGQVFEVFERRLCGYDLTYHTVGATVEGNVYAWTDGACTVASVFAGSLTSQIASTRSLDEIFVSAAAETSGAQRLQRYEWVTDQGIRVGRTHIGPMAYDAELARGCTPSPVGSAGDEACVPVWDTNGSATLYRSPDCTGTTVQGLPACHPAQTTLWFVAIPNTPRCSGFSYEPRVYDVAATGPLSYRLDGQCVVIDTVASPVYIAYQSEPLTIGDLVPMTRVLDLP